MPTISSGDRVFTVPRPVRLQQKTHFILSSTSNIFVVSPARRAALTKLELSSLFSPKNELQSSSVVVVIEYHTAQFQPSAIESRNLAKSRTHSWALRVAEAHFGSRHSASRSASPAQLADFLGSCRPPFNNHLKRTETQASEKQGNETTMALLEVVVVAARSAALV